MNKSLNNIKKLARIKLSVLALIFVSAFGAYATMGIYNSGKNPDRPRTKLLAQKSTLKPGTFSLKSGYEFRGGRLNTTNRPSYISLNGAATYQIGNTAYVVPLKKQFLMGKVVINPR